MLYKHAKQNNPFAACMQMYIWDIATGSCRGVIGEEGDGVVSTLAVCPRQQIVAAAAQGVVHVYQMEYAPDIPPLLRE
jgi:hypothetical protein